MVDDIGEHRNVCLRRTFIRRAWPGVERNQVHLGGNTADQLIRGIPAKVNLIPFNPWPGAPYECSTEADIAMFADIVNHAGYSSPVRAPRGRDILAACGQLKTASERERRSA